MCVVDDTMLRRGMVKSNDLSHLEVVIADSLICDIKANLFISAGSLACPASLRSRALISHSRSCQLPLGERKSYQLGCPTSLGHAHASCCYSKPTQLL
jgi:hypothetical protein